MPRKEENQRYFFAKLALLLMLQPAIGSSSEGSITEKIHLRKGEQYRLKQRGIKKYSIGDKNVIRARALHSSGELLIKGLRTGSSDLILWTPRKTHRFLFKITDLRNPSGLKTVISKIKSLKGVSIQEVGNSYYIKGTLQRVSDSNFIINTVSAHPEIFVNQTTLNPALLQAIQLKINSLLEVSSFTNLRCIKSGNALSITGETESEEQEKEILELARSEWQGVNGKFKRGFASENMANVQLLFLETEEIDFRNIGLQWDKEVPNVLSFANGKLYGNYAVNAFLNQIEQSGKAKLIANPEVSLIKGVNSRIFSGGEIPVKTTSPERNEVTWRRYGVEMNIETLGVTKSKLRLHMDIAFSNPNWSNSLDGLPTVSKSEFSTTMDLKSGDLVFLSGLYQRALSENESGLPILSALPIVGSLFGSNIHSKSIKKLLIGIFPRSIDWARKLKNDFQPSKLNKGEISEKDISILKKEGIW